MAGGTRLFGLRDQRHSGLSEIAVSTGAQLEALWLSAPPGDDLLLVDFDRVVDRARFQSAVGEGRLLAGSLKQELHGAGHVGLVAVSELGLAYMWAEVESEADWLEVQSWLTLAGVSEVFVFDLIERLLDGLALGPPLRSERLFDVVLSVPNAAGLVYCP